jgi:hypothetical protein
MAPGGDDANATGRGRGRKRSRRGVNRLTLRARLEIGALQRTRASSGTPAADAC